MSKRVLRNRSTLRADSDEPPRKKPLQAQFPLEDVPQEFYNLILEKMPLNDYKQFNLGCKFSARICEEFEMKDGPLDLEELPVDLYSTIVEKLPFKDLTMFNHGSRLTEEMCERLREIEAPVVAICVRQEEESFNTAKKMTLLNQVPQKIRLRTKRLDIDKKDLTAIKKYKIRAYKVRFYGDSGTDPEFVEQVIMFVSVDASSGDLLRFDFSRNFETGGNDQGCLRSLDNFDDRDLLDIDQEWLTVGRQNRPVPSMSVTPQGMLQLLQEWKAGTRRIKKIRIMFGTLDRRLIRKEFPGPQPQKGRVILCRDDGESDCAVFNDAHSVNFMQLKCRHCLSH